MKKEVKKEFKYQYDINGKLALGYGSKYQLLRMLGYHREDFTNKIKESISYKGNIKWIDFKYDGCLDSELLNLDFISSLKDKWRKYWACGKGGINWDAVGICDDGTYIFIEAKAHLDEFDHIDADGSVNPKSKENHIKRIKELLDKYKIDIDPVKLDEQYYQLINRLVITDFVNSNGLKAKLVYVLFENGYEYNCKDNKSTNKTKWEKNFQNKMTLLNINNEIIKKLLKICTINCKIITKD